MKWFWRKPPPIVQPPPAATVSRRIDLGELMDVLSNFKQRAPVAALDWTRTHDHKIPRPLKGVVPADAKPMLAMDSAWNANNIPLYGVIAVQGAWDGYSFMGYSLLSELAQVTEYRRPSEILANEMTRKWGKLVSKSNVDKTERIKNLTDRMKKFQVQEVFRGAFELDNFFGIGHLFIDLGAGSREELKTPLIVAAKVTKGSLKALRLIEPIWTYPNQYNASDPLRDDFYRPQTWFIMGTEVHASRVLSFVSRPVPDMLKPAYMFGGVALTQLLNPYVQNWIRTRQSVSDITHNFSTPVLGVDMDQMTTTEGAKSLMIRGQIYNISRDNQGLFIISKEKESFDIKSAPLAGLSDLQAQAEEQMAFPSGLTLTKLFGITPKGLNASSEDETRSLYDTVASVQERIGTPHLMTIIDILQMDMDGTIDPDIGWKWYPLWSSTDKERAEIEKMEADTDAVRVESNVLDPLEVRKTLAATEDSRYSSINVDVLPEQSEEEQADLGTVAGQFGASLGEREDEERRPDDDRERSSLLRRPSDRQLTTAERGARE